MTVFTVRKKNSFSQRKVCKMNDEVLLELAATHHQAKKSKCFSMQAAP